MLYGTTQNYYQPTSNYAQQNYYQPNTSNMYSNPFLSSAMQPLPTYQTQNTTSLYNQSYSTMFPQQSYATQNYNYSPVQQQSSSINPMLMNILSMLMQFLPVLLGRNSQQLNPVSTTPVYATPGTDEVISTSSTDQPVAANNFFQKFMQELIGLNGQKDAAQDTKIADVETKNAAQDTAIAANTTAIAANDEKDTVQDSKIATVETKNTAQDTEITSLKTQIADLKAALTANTAKDATQDIAIDELKTPEFLAKNLSSAELNWLKSSNIDLTQVDTDGSPTYLVAKGQQDGKYHIYKQYNKTQYKSVISVPTGNNYIYTNDVASNKNMANIAKSIGGDFVINQGKYTTGSPLILDTNENGTVEAQQGIGVDIDQNGAADGAAVNGDKMLAMSDANGNGKIDGTEVFGNETINPFTGEKIEATNGFESLKQVAISAEAKTGATIIEDNKVNVVKLQEALKSIGSNLGLISDSNVTELESLGNVSKIGLAYEDKNDDIDYIENNINSSSVSLQNGSYETTEGKTNKVDDVWFKLA